MDLITLAVAKKYTDDSMAGAGAVAGVPCQIQSITEITGGHRITFLWVDNDGESHTNTMDVMDGQDGATGQTGATGVGIQSVAVDASNHLQVTYTNGNTVDAGEITLDSCVQKASIISKTIYIDYVNGSDSNDGLSSGNPLKTIDKALELYQYASALTFNIMSDYTGDIKALGTAYCNCKSFALQSANSADIKTITGNIELGWIEYVSIRNINFVSSLKSNVYRALNLRYVQKVLLYNIEVDLTNTYSNVDTSYIQFQNCGFVTIQNKIVFTKNVSSTKTIVDAILVNGGNCNITLDNTSSITGATNGIRVRNGSCASISSEVLDYITATNKTAIGDEMSSLFIGGNLQNQNFVSKTETEIVFTGTMEEYEAAKSSIPDGAAVLIKGNNDLTSLRNIAIQSIGLEYGRANGTSYYIARIPKHAVNGMRITPKVRLTSANGEVGTSSADYTSALTYAKTKGSIFTINAGLFKISGDCAPHGRTIVDGIAVTDEDAGETVSSVSEHEVYPLCIDENGNLSTPYDRDVPCATMIAGGVKQAVTGWGTVVQNYEETDSTVFDEQKHVGDYIRQGIGQYQNGDYFVLTTDGVKTTEVNETGMTYEEIAAICIAKGVKFFYSLDGGGSAETVIGDRQINLIYENASGRVVPTVIEFVLEVEE